MTDMEPWRDQRTPALAIVARGDQIRKVTAAHFTVASQSTPEQRYAVRLTGDRWTCTCAFAQSARTDCIHVLAVRFRGDIRSALEPALERPACDACGSADVVQNGKRLNKSGAVVRWRCRACKHDFTGKDGFKKRRSEPRIIALSLDLYFRGMSVRKVAEHLAQAYGLRVSQMTVYRWVRHFGSLAAAWMDEQQARTGDRWHVDETVVNVNGQNTYLWNVLDGDTRFLLATHISHARGMDDTRTPLRKAKAVTPDRPSEVFTDGMQAYPYAVWKELGTKPNGLGNPHRRVPSIRAAESNNRIERFHGTEKERIKTMRAFDNHAGAAGIAEGFRVHYNMVRTHQALGTTPGEAAGLAAVHGFKWQSILAEAERRARAKAAAGAGAASAEE